MVTTAYISLGGNMGGEKGVFAEALRQIASWEGVCVGKISSLYRTEPQGDAGQNWFQNQVAELSCKDIRPALLLNSLLELETALGRTRDAARRFGPRSIDLDLLLFGCIVAQDEGIILPHPRMAGRAFVLVPLLEIAPEAALPDGTKVDSCLKKLAYSVVGNVIYQK